jgi:two-component system cell cycle sensor histidine kinase/response regulator CckA
MAETERRRTAGRRGNDLEQRRYKALFESTAVGITLVDDDRRIVDCNAAYCRLLGRDRSEVVGHLASEFNDGPDDALTAEMERLTAGAVDSFAAEKRYRRPGGESVPVRITTSVVSRTHNLFVGIVEDMTERGVAEERLHEKAAVLARAHEVARLGSFTVDVRARTVRASREVARLVGLETAFVCGVDEFRSRFVHEEDRDEWAAGLERTYEAGGGFSLDARLYRADGGVIWARVHGSVEADEHGRPLGAIGVVQDVSEQRRLEDQVRQAQKLEAVGQLASGIAHDFNNLLLVIGGNAQLALTADDDEVEVELGEILRATERARGLIRQLLAFSRADASEPETMQLNRAVEHVRLMLDRLLQATIEVETNLSREDTTVFADAGQLEQVLLNLAVNARDAMREGGRLTLATESDSEWVTLRVADTGTGMDEATRMRAFDPFFTTKPPGQGTGLGLSTAYGMVTKAGGRISLDTAPGRGTTVTIRLPHAERAVEPDEVGALRPLVPGAGERILVVEDDPMVRAVAAELLSVAGYEIHTAENGERALALFDAGESFDLIVSDLMMPRMTGPQMTAALRRRGHVLPTVYTSGYADADELPPADEPQTSFVAKPFSGEQVTSAVRDLLAQRAA